MKTKRCSARLAVAGLCLSLCVSVATSAGAGASESAARSTQGAVGGLRADPAGPPPAGRSVPLSGRRSAAPVTFSWQALTHAPSFNPRQMMLLSDGTVMVQDHGACGCGSAHWWRLTPDNTGSYVNGTWTQLADMPSGYQPLDYASAVLPDGRVIVEGGEYNGAGAVWTNLGAIYDPTNNTWTSVAAPTGWSKIGDAQSVVLSDGTFMMADIFSGNAAALNASSLTWTTPFGTGKADKNDEEGWSLLPNGKVLTVDVANGTNSEVFNPATKAWSSAGSTIVTLPSYGAEIGAQILSPLGWTFAAGGTKHTATYSGTTWTAGPDFPVNTGNGLENDSADAPAAVLPNGNVLVAASPYTARVTWKGGTDFFEFDGSTLVNVNPAAPESQPSWIGTMLLLPTGQVMFSDGTNISVFTDTRAPLAVAKPTIMSAPGRVLRGATYTITGNQLNGLSEGSSYGDDAQNSTNYPLVRITNNVTGHVFYARTLMDTRSVAPNQSGSATFKVPATIEQGASTLVVVANGIASSPQPIDIGAGEFTGTGVANPYGITAGPDGALWFTNYGNDSIGRITTGGTVTNNYTGTGISGPEGIAVGPDGGLWFVNNKNSSIGRITTGGTVTNYTGTGISAPEEIAAGPDGALWFTNFGNSSIGRITTGGTVTNFTSANISKPGGIAAGPDGALWFTNGGGAGSIGRITTGGTVTKNTGTGISSPQEITAGPDGALWFANLASHSIGRITTGGTVTNYTAPGIVQPSGIAPGPDGALWFTDYGGPAIGRITTSGAITVAGPGGTNGPSGITSGPDRALWFTNFNGNSIGKDLPVGPTVSGVTFTGTTAAPQITITGSGFGSAEPYPSYAPGCGTTGHDYGYYLSLHDGTAGWDAGRRLVNGATDCVGFAPVSWSDNQIVLGFGSGYNTNGWVLNSGDSYSLNVFSTPINGTVMYTPSVLSFTGPTTLQSSQFTALFSQPVKGVTTSTFAVVEVGNHPVSGTVSCLDASSTAVNCAAGPVSSATFTTTSPLIAGEYYFVNINVGTPPPGINGFTTGTTVPATQGYERAPTTVNAFQYPLKYAWGKVKNAGALGGSYLQEAFPGATLTFTASGTSIGLIMWKGPDGGTASVKVTNTGGTVKHLSIDTYAAAAGDATTTVSGLTNTAHRVTITVDGTFNPPSTGSKVRLDATVSGGVTNATPKVTAFWPNYPGAYVYTNTKGASVSFMFRGAGVSWTAVTGPNDGTANVTIDGGLVATEDLYAPGFGDTVYSYGGLDDTFHRVVVTVTGKKNAASSDRVVTLKSFTVQ